MDKELSLTKNIGTPGYMAPELEANENYNDKVDIYALGLILFEMFNIFKTRHERFMLMSNLSKKHQLPPKFEKKFTIEAHLIKWMTQRNQHNRPNSSEILKSLELKNWEQKISIIVKEEKENDI